MTDKKPKKIKETKTIKTNKPYILEIKKFKENEKYLNNKSYLEINEKNDELGPLSGSELKYEPEKWNQSKTIDSHNCYSYALGNIIKKLESKAQPGYASGFEHIEDNEYECKSFRERLKKDSPGSYLEKFNQPCLPGFYKIFLALDPKNDYHWWRQDNSSYWSHKPGATEVVDVDADGKKIKNPLKANRNYGSLNYYKPCFFTCVYSDLTRSLDTIYNISYDDNK